jgi:hypothetical protein
MDQTTVTELIRLPPDPELHTKLPAIAGAASDGGWWRAD